jgi:FixJ family two-component response regulator
LETLAARQPSSARALVTGFPDREVRAHAKAYGGYVLEKPFGRQQVDWLLRVARPPARTPLEVTAEIAREIQLSPQQTRSLEALVREQSYDAVAASLEIERSTLKQHVHALLAKARRRWPDVLEAKDLVLRIFREAARR